MNSYSFTQAIDYDILQTFVEKNKRTLYFLIETNSMKDNSHSQINHQKLSKLFKKLQKITQNQL